MTIWEQFRFRINISRDYYEKKSDAIACLSREGAKAIGKEKMAFDEHNVTVSEFLNYALTGHAFCNLFSFDPNQQYWIQTSTGLWSKETPVYRKGDNAGAMKLQFKNDNFFNGSQAVFVDVDYTRFQNVMDYLNTLTYRPTCVYMSYSDNVPKHSIVSRRFRMVYVMDKVLDKDEFVSVATAINDQIVIDTAEPMEDDCGTRMSQYMNGVFGNKESYLTNIIYSVDDFPSSVPDVLILNENDSGQTNPGIVFNDDLLRDMSSLDYKSFMHFYSTRYCYVYRTERPQWETLGYQLTDDNYLQLWYYRETQTDGMKRRRKLFKNACLRRLMYPDIDANTLLFNLYVDLVRFFDNSDGVITMDTLLRKVKNAMEMSLEQLVAYCDFEIRYWRENRPKYICQSGINTTMGVQSIIEKDIRWKEIDKSYNRLLSVKDNAELLNEPLSTLYRFCQENHILTNPHKQRTKEKKRADKKMKKLEKKALFRKYYNPQNSLRKNQEMLEIYGVSLSKDTITKWAKTYL